MVFIKLVLFFPCRRVFVIDYMLWDCVVWLLCCCLALPKCSLILRADALCPIVFWPEWWWDKLCLWTILHYGLLAIKDPGAYTCLRVRERFGCSFCVPPLCSFWVPWSGCKNGGGKCFVRNIANVDRICLKMVLNDVKSQGDHFLVWWFVTKVRNKKVARVKCFGPGSSFNPKIVSAWARPAALNAAYRAAKWRPKCPDPPSQFACPRPTAPSSHESL